MADTMPLFTDLPCLFGSGFLQDYAGQIMSDPRMAIVELIANAYDAGATRVDVQWPSEPGLRLAVTDNGTGMTELELGRRWKTFPYDRQKEQGPDVLFPPGVTGHHRQAFGRSGKGRFAPFCFADSYCIETWKNDRFIRVLVKMTDGGLEPFAWNIEGQSEKKGHGTCVSTDLTRRFLSVEEVSEIIGAKFLVDPSFAICVNKQPVQLLGLKSLVSTTVPVQPHGAVAVRRIDSAVQDRVVRLRGITWWVNQRMVGEPSWEGLDGEGAYLDGRTAEARRYSFVVEADLLRESVKADWSGFHANGKVNAVRDAVHRHVVETLSELLSSTRKEQKKAALARHRDLLGGLPVVSRKMVGQFVEQVLEKCPTITPRDLSRTVAILGKLEQSQSAYDLLKSLAECSPEDLDRWNQLMQEFSARNAEIILTELQKRLTLIERLQELVGSRKTDELHDLQPLFERGLWIFGPEYEAVDFRSNLGLARIIRGLLGGTDKALPIRRPDFVALADTSIGVYSAAEYKDNGEISGVRKVLIVELKKGGFTLTQKEVDQARDYAKELRKGTHVSPTTEIVAYVLGTLLEEGLQVARMGERNETQIIPMIYQTILDRAHSRTFNLQRRLKESGPKVDSDSEVEEVLAQPVQGEMFEESGVSKGEQ